MAKGSLPLRTRLLGMTSTLEACRVAGVSMVGPATCTESVRGGISSCGVAGGASVRGGVLKPGAATTSRVSGVSGASNWKLPLGAAVVWATTPTRLTAAICAPETGAPDGSTILPLISEAERQAEQINKQASRPGMARSI